MIERGFLCISIFLVWSQAPAQDFQGTLPPAQKVADRWGGWDRVLAPKVISQMSDEERQSLIHFYKAQMREDSSAGLRERDAMYGGVLLKLGDPDAVREVVTTVKRADITSAEFQRALDALVRAKRPETIALLGEILNLREEFREITRGDVGAMVPRSYAVAYAVLQIASNEIVFPQAVAKWARDNARVRADKLQPVVREWWAENREALEKGRFQNIKPGKDLYSGELARSNALMAARNEYAANLRKHGKDIGDQRNWDEWRTSFLPKFIDPEETRAFGLEQVQDSNEIAAPEKPPKEGPVQESR